MSPKCGTTNMLVNQISFEAEIDNFYKRLVEEITYFSSPIFQLSNAKMEITIFYDIYKCIAVFLTKAHPLSPSTIYIAFTAGIKRSDGSLLQSEERVAEFPRSGGSQKGFSIPVRTLLDSRDELSPGGTLTVICTARLVDIATAEASTRTSSSDTTKSRSRQQDVEKSLSCQDGVSKLSDDFKELYLSRHESDITVKVKNKEFAAHKLVLSARSPVFRTMFQVDMVEKNEGCVNIDDCEPDSFQDFLVFLYSGNLDVVSASNAIGLYATAKKYQVDQLKVACSEHLAREISVESVCDVILLATLHDEETSLLSIATEYFINKADEIVKTPKWLLFLSEHPVLANELLVKMTSKKYKK